MKIIQGSLASSSSLSAHTHNLRYDIRFIILDSLLVGNVWKISQICL
jgi:hypothetical protein